ncbi:MAG: hypothetical protein KAX16_06185 [Actinomycetia bacterium]|nr:hypothetical protein [Actinomycetes bacterium]
MIKNKLSAHTFLLAAFPILFLYQYNIDETSIDEVLPFILMSLATTLVLFFVARFFLKDASKAALAISAFLILFFSYGHVAQSTRRWNPAGIDNEIILMILFVFLVIGAVGLLAKTQRNLDNFSNIFNVTAAALIATSLVNIGLAQIQGLSVDQGPVNQSSSKSAKVIDLEDIPSRPDIYYIVLDSYPSESNIREVYKYDNHDFFDYLEKKGFYVASKSRSNYVQTYLSLASSLNMQYINDLGDTLGTETKSLAKPKMMLRNNKAMMFLKDRGYKFVHVRSGWTGTDYNKYADIQINSGYGSEFATTLLGTTALRFLDSQIGLVEKGARARILSIFENVPKVSRITEPTFTFAHIVPPHPPYFFGAKGEHVKRVRFKLKGRVWAEKDKYIDQVRFVNEKVKVMIDTIIANSDIPPIILLQGDHGPASSIYTDKKGNWRNPTDRQLKERTGILNAYYLPGGKDAQLYPTISPVNSLKYVFNAYFDANFERLPDETFYSNYQKPYLFKNIDDRIR